MSALSKQYIDDRTASCAKKRQVQCSVLRHSCKTAVRAHSERAHAWPGVLSAERGDRRTERLFSPAQLKISNIIFFMCLTSACIVGAREVFGKSPLREPWTTPQVASASSRTG